MSKYFIYFFKKFLNNFRIFSHMQEKKLIYFILIVLGFVWQKSIFLCNKISKNKLKRCFPNTPLSPKTLSKKLWQTKQGIKPCDLT